MKNNSLIDKIESLFNEEFILQESILQYLNSNLSINSIEDLSYFILNNDSSSEKETLLSLLILPDESFQAELEDIIENQSFDLEDEKEILYLLDKKNIVFCLRFPKSIKTIKIKFPNWLFPQFISNLKITKKLDKKIIDAINKYIPEQKSIVKVKLRNSEIKYTESIIIFLCAFFEKIKYNQYIFFEYLETVIGWLTEIFNEDDVYNYLIKKKEFYFKNLKKAEDFDESLKKNNIETIMLQRTPNLSISKDDMYRKIAIIDDITRNFI
ncbi:MAG: hypothetical protein HQK79_21595 [Desulfobacterales bacterium]|nr:hypothetical protein [Desulfobacterales bacterium]MBF0397281.1 hypothetical protein [Desulfobacterales bacterium]